MSERYVKEILEKLEEIEKLHAKLRSLVPRVKNYESENSSSNAIPKRLINMENKLSDIKEKNGNSINFLPEQKPIDVSRSSEIFKNTLRNSTTRLKKIFRPDKSIKSLRKFRDRFSNKWERFRKDSVDFASKQWQEKNDKIRNFLSTINQPDMILVSRGSQTSDDLANIPMEKKSTILSPKKNRFFERRRSTLQDLSERLLERFDYIRDPKRVKESTVSMPDRCLGKDEPHRVRKTLIIPDGEAETLKIVSSARQISVDDNGKRSSLSRAHGLSRV